MLVQLVLILSSIGAILRLIGFKRTRDLLERFSSMQPASYRLEATEASRTANCIARLVGIAANHGPYRATCLRQSLVLWWLLRRRGISAELRIGVRKDGKDLDAHAWVEHKDATLGREDLGYTMFKDLRFGNHV